MYNGISKFYNNINLILILQTSSNKVINCFEISKQEKVKNAKGTDKLDCKNIFKINL